MTSKTGSCLCGQVRYEISGDFQLIENCHCTDCQRQAGGPYVTFLDLKRADFRWTTEPPAYLSLSKGANRGFCPNCGTFLSFEDDHPDQTMSVTGASLDDQEYGVPEREIWTCSRLPWVAPIPGARQLEKNAG